ncbi:hypothetical protein C8R46DRAFT_1352435 [Mycena filopes]|nr:hypothetical protein C8R46DRAFT_1352435 [Mycena filopes]
MHPPPSIYRSIASTSTSSALGTPRPRPLVRFQLVFLPPRSAETPAKRPLHIDGWVADACRRLAYKPSRSVTRTRDRSELFPAPPICPSLSKCSVDHRGFGNDPLTHSYWHGIALENPTLWSNIEINYNCVLGSTQSTTEKTLELLSARLERSRDARLSISLRASVPSAYDSQPIHPRFFDLLAQHWQRWERVYAGCSLKGADVSVLQRRLPSLKSLTLYGVPDTLEFFGASPLLDKLMLGPTALKRTTALAAILRYGKLRSFTCLAIAPSHFREAISLLPKLHVGADFQLATCLDPRIIRSHWSFSLDLPSICAPISTLACIAEYEFQPSQLCSLGKVIFQCRLYPRFVHEWPHSAFLSLCQRSNLGRCLKTLRIVDVRITGRDLLEVLSVLEALEHLEVGELITDNFLRALTWTAGHDCLVPRLSYLTCVSRFAFTHGRLVDLVASRLPRPATSQSLLHLYIYPFPGSAVFLDSTAHTMLQNLMAVNRRFVYLSGEDYMSTRVTP